MDVKYNKRTFYRMRDLTVDKFLNKKKNNRSKKLGRDYLYALIVKAHMTMEAFIKGSRQVQRKNVKRYNGNRG